MNQKQHRMSFSPKSTNIGKMDNCNAQPEPGEEYENWMKITKHKLKTREDKLMWERISTLQSIINVECVAFEKLNSLNCSTQRVSVTDYDKVISNDLISECLDKLHLALSLWNGVNLRKTKTAPSTFHKYFVIGKSWFDQKKKNILTPDFWIKFLVDLEQFVIDAASKYFNHRCHSLQKQYSKELLFRIVSGIFAGELQYQSTKAQPLIPCGVLKDEEAMKQYLSNLHHSLNIDAIIDKYSSSSSHSINAKDLLCLLNKQLTHLTNQYHQEFQTSFQALWNDVTNTVSEITPQTNQRTQCADAEYQHPSHSTTHVLPPAVHTHYPPVIRPATPPPQRPRVAHNAFTPHVQSLPLQQHNLNDDRKCQLVLPDIERHHNNDYAYGHNDHCNAQQQPFDASNTVENGYMYPSENMVPVTYNDYTDIDASIYPSFERTSPLNTMHSNCTVDTYNPPQPLHALENPMCDYSPYYGGYNGYHDQSQCNVHRFNPMNNNSQSFRNSPQ